MDLLDNVEQRLKEYPNVRYERTPNSIHYLPWDASGFEVGIHRGFREVDVSFSGWHETFDSEHEAIDCFLFGLSSRCRLKVIRRGSCDYRWIVQAFRDGEWVSDSEVGLLLFPFWRRRTERFLQNHVFPD